MDFENNKDSRLSSSCIFCRISNGEIPCAKVYADERVMAFLDMGPARPGHVLVIPKTHHANLLDTPLELVPAIFSAQQAIGKALMKTVGAEGFNIVQNNFPAAGQAVFHVHWHIIPRVAGDGLGFWEPGKYASLEAMKELADKIAAEV